VAENGVAAPRARVRASACGDERDGAAPVMPAPRFQIKIQVDGRSIRKGEGIQILDERARGRRDDLITLLERDAGNAMKLLQTALDQMRQELAHGRLSLANHDDIRAVRQIPISIVGWLRTAN